MVRKLREVQRFLLFDVAVQLPRLIFVRVRDTCETALNHLCVSLVAEGNQERWVSLRAACDQARESHVSSPMDLTPLRDPVGESVTYREGRLYIVVETRDVNAYRSWPRNHFQSA